MATETLPKTMSGEEMIALSKKHTLFEWSAQSKVDPIPVARAKGIYFWTPEGKRFIDFNSQLMCVNIGHGDAGPEKGFYYRSDHFNFAKQGVPALNPDAGVDYVGKPPEYAKQVRTEWNEKRYHQPTDVVLPDWDLSGAREELAVRFAVGYRVAQAD